jgi:hypothetical protein
MEELDATYTDIYTTTLLDVGDVYILGDGCDRDY